MKLTIEPTEEFFLAGDVIVRMWGGTALMDDGATSPVVVLVTAVAFPGQAEGVAEGLISIPPPTEEDAQAWAKKIMGRL